ncbi:MAG: hypothetical protein R2865_09965 [Deinococcales bacterium]
MNEADRQIYKRDRNYYWLYHDPASPPLLSEAFDEMSEAYAWGFALVAVWSGQLDPADGVMVDISPLLLAIPCLYHRLWGIIRDFMIWWRGARAAPSPKPRHRPSL